MRLRRLRSTIDICAAALLTAALLAAVSLPALANEEGSGHEPETFLGLPRWVWLWANLLLFLGILGYFIVPGVRQFLESRSKEIADNLERARTQQEEARRMRQDLSNQIESLHREMDDLVKRTESDAEREREEILAQAERESNDLAASEKTARRLIAAFRNSPRGYLALAETLEQRQAYEAIVEALAPAVSELRSGSNAVARVCRTPGSCSTPPMLTS